MTCLTISTKFLGHLKVLPSVLFAALHIDIINLDTGPVGGGGGVRTSLEEGFPSRNITTFAVYGPLLAIEPALVAGTAAQPVVIQFC